MKRILKYITQVVVFVIIFCLLLDKITYALYYKQPSGDNISAFYLEERNSVDVVMVGSSHAYASFSPMELWGQKGVTSYNLGTPSQSIPTSYFLIKEAIRTQNPEVIIMESYGAIYEDYYHTDSRLHIALDGIPYSLTKLEILTDFLPRFMDYKEITEFALPIVKFHSRWYELKERDLQHKNLELKGYHINTKIKQVKTPEYTDETSPIFDGTIEYMDKIIEICEENDVELILFKAPMAAEDSYNYSLKINTLFEYVAEKGIAVIDTDDYIEEMGLDYKKDFRNTTHLNHFGALKSTQFLIDYLTANYELTDHRNDEEYSEWEDSYEQYTKRIEKKLKEWQKKQKKKKKK